MNPSINRCSVPSLTPASNGYRDILFYHYMNKMNKQVLRLAIPNIISNLSVPLLGVVDTALMGRLEAEQYIGAVAVGGIIFTILYWGFGFLRMGTTGLTAQAYGAASLKESLLILKRGVLVALLSSLLLIVFQSVIATVSFYLIDASAEVEQLAREYFDIRIYAAPATLGLYAFHGWFLGMQNATYPMILSVLVNLANIGLNLFFVKVLLMKSSGVALGTAIAQYFGLLGAIVLFLKKYSHLLDGWRLKEVLDLLSLRRFFSLSRDIFIRTLCLVLSHAFFMSKSAALSDRMLAINTILLQFINLLAYGIDGFAFAVESLVGRYKGANEICNLKRAVKYAFLWALLLSGGLTLIFGGFGAKLLYLFTNKTDLVRQAIPYMIWITIAPLINTAAYIWDGVFLGATASKPMRNAIVASTFLVFLPAYYLLTPLGNHGLWLALTLLSVARSLSLSALAPKHIFSSL